MKFKSLVSAFVACAAAVVSFTSRATALPDGYIPVEYIESTGVEAIDTGIKVQDHIEVEVDYAYTTLDAASYMVAGLPSTENNGDRLYLVSVYKNSSNVCTWRISVGNKIDATGSKTALGSPVAGTRYVVKAGVEGNKVDLQVTNDNIPNRYSYEFPDKLAGKNTTTTLGLFASHGTSATQPYSSFTKAKLYRCSIWVGGKLERYFVPCYKGSDIGVYDTVKGSFYKSAPKTSSFTKKGPEVKLQSIEVNVTSSEAEGPADLEKGHFTPALGVISQLPSLDPIVFTAPEEFVSSVAGRKGTVTGGTLYEIDGDTATVVATTETTTLSYTSTGLPLQMVWTATYSDGYIGKEFYADPVNGSDDNDGSEGAPFLTLKKAHTVATNYITSASGKAVIHLAEGRFDQSTRIQLIAGESIIGAGADKTFINETPNTSNTSSSTYAFQLVGADSLLSSLCVTGFVGGIAKTIWVVDGVVEHCRSAYNTAKGNSSNGRGIYIEGGTVQDSEFDHNTAPDMYTQGAGAWIGGGTLTRCDIHDNTGKDLRSCFGNGLYMNGGTVSRCRIYSNGVDKGATTDSNGGVWIEKGTLHNSLVYGNFGGTATLGGGIHNKGGNVRYCTIYNNKASGDTTGASGYTQTSGGNCRNTIIFGNFKPGAAVSGGTFTDNLLDAAVSGYADGNYVATEVGFADAANADFHIVRAASPAVGKAAPMSSYPTDFEGTTRDPEKPTIGAYEYVAGSEAFGAEIRILKPEYRAGDAPSVELVVTGVSEDEQSNLEISWFLDGAEVPAAANLKEPTFEGVALGRHTVKAVATYKGETKTDEKADAFAVLPTKVYVNKTGSGTFPYASFETGTDNITEALSALWKSNDETTTVEVDEGEYDLGSPVVVQYAVAIVGQDKEQTILKGRAMSARLLTLDDAKARLEGVTVSDAVSQGALHVKDGTVDNCRIVNCTTGEAEMGAGAKMDGGKILNSEFDGCVVASYKAKGGGLAILGKTALVSNCVFTACQASAGTREPENHGGGAIYAQNGTVTHCKIVNCSEDASHRGQGTAVWSVNGTGDTSNFTLRNCLIAGCRSFNTEVIVLKAGTMENCTVADNTMPTGVAAVNCGGTVRNCVVWNGCTDIAVNGGSVSYSCYSNATEGEDGNTASDPKFRGVKHGEYKISSKSKAFRAGTVRSWMTGATDILGNPRLTDDKVDMGCYQVGFDPGLMIMIW